MSKTQYVLAQMVAHITVGRSPLCLLVFAEQDPLVHSSLSSSRAGGRWSTSSRGPSRCSADAVGSAAYCQPCFCDDSHCLYSTLARILRWWMWGWGVGFEWTTSGAAESCRRYGRCEWGSLTHGWRASGFASRCRREGTVWPYVFTLVSML